MNRINEINTKTLDIEWIELIKMAKEIGLTLDEIRDFLRNPSK